MKFIKGLGKLAIGITAFLYALCLFNGVTFFEYTVTDQGGILSVAGKSVEINTDAARIFWKTYANAEAQAAEWLPSKVQSAIEQLSSLLNGSKR